MKKIKKYPSANRNPERYTMTKGGQVDEKFFCNSVKKQLNHFELPPGSNIKVVIVQQQIFI